MRKAHQAEYEFHGVNTGRVRIRNSFDVYPHQSSNFQLLGKTGGLSGVREGSSKMRGDSMEMREAFVGASLRDGSVGVRGRSTTGRGGSDEMKGF